MHLTQLLEERGILFGDLTGHLTNSLAGCHHQAHEPQPERQGAPTRQDSIDHRILLRETWK